MNPAATAVSETPVPFHPASTADYVPREPLRGLQSERLRQVVCRAYEHVPLVRQRMQKLGLSPAEVRGVDDIHRLPFTTAADLRGAYPMGMLAAPVQQVLRLHPCGGAAGRPIVAPYTRRDLEVQAEAVVRCLASCGVRQGDTIQNLCGYELLGDGLGLHHASETLGASIIPFAGGDAARQIMLMKDLGVTVICSTPSYFLYLAERAEKMGVDLRELPLRAGIFLGEPWSEAMRRRIEETAGIRAYDVYGLAEGIAPAMGAECCHHGGLHVFEDHFYPEIVDPATGSPLAEGQEGELVLTALSREAMPLIRYRTRDLTALLVEPCPCGRTMRRMQRIERRSDEMFVLQGVQVFPSQVEAALLAVEGTLPHYQIVLTQEKGLDQVEVLVEVTPQVFSDRVGALESLQARLAHEIEHTLGVSLPVRLVEPQTIQRGQGTAQRVVDKRGASLPPES